MSILFDDSPVMLFASAAGLIMCFDLMAPIPVSWTTSEKDEKYSSFNGLAFSRGGTKMSV